MSGDIFVKGAKNVRKVCPRCSNIVDMVLVRDIDLMFGLLAKFRADFIGMRGYYNFRLKCPICIYEEKLTVQQAFSLMET
jgi:hypothetical protein